jgi:L-lactate permease
MAGIIMLFTIMIIIITSVQPQQQSERYTITSPGTIRALVAITIRAQMADLIIFSHKSDCLNSQQARVNLEFFSAKKGLGCMTSLKSESSRER